ncbi:MAG: hypothetical protein GXP54_05640 [Deltaproteobacteria bacterium]|nr:hypothetical protein [Deltaproteobacteria bacterium]
MKALLKAAFAMGILMLGVAPGCGSDSTLPPGDANVSDGGGDVVFTDNCQCQTAAQCEGKVQVTQCSTAECVACGCVAKPKDKGTACDDGDVATVNDTCNGEGQCVGQPTSCGNDKCESNENCGNCIGDCPCADGEFCAGTTCQKAVCGNSQCEAPAENCENCFDDCSCKKGEQACHEKECLDCAAYCKATGKECCDTETDPGCAQTDGCNCGQCSPGFSCDGFNHCYSSDICNNGKCEPSENCDTCPADCACQSGQKCACNKYDAGNKCVDAVCLECSDVCAEAGKECGFYEGCDCGSCQVCYKCQQNQCNPKCDCVCWQKECGEIGQCKCGANEGACTGTQECVGFKCLEGCDTLCAGVECGWAGDCICDVCGDCGACQDNKCGPGSSIDEYDAPPYNDFPDTATDMGSTTDDNTASAKEFNATIDVDFDQDWFKVEVQDKAGQTLIPHVELLGLDEDKDLDLEVCFVCKYGDLAGVAPKPADLVFETDSVVPGGRCFVSMLNLWGQDEMVELDQITCDGDPQDDSGTVYVHVYPAYPEDCGASYKVKWNM